MERPLRMGRPKMTTSTGLYACLYVKEFPAQSMLRLRPELRVQPCVVIEGEPPQEYACSLNTKARRLGIAVGMTRVEIETFSSVSVLSRSQMEEEAAKAALLECCDAFSPRLEAGSRDRACFCVLDIAGMEKLFGPPVDLARSLLQRVKALGIGASIAISSSFHAAVCVARWQASRMDVSIIPQGAESNALSQLPLAVLGLSEEHAETFSLWGIRTLGMLAALPEKELISRLGQEGKRLRQLALGQRPHLFRPLESVFSLEERMELDTPVEQLESLLFALNVMLEQLILRAGSRTLALASVHLALSLEDKSIHLRTVRPALPTNDRPLWLKLLQLDLEAHPPQAPILSLTLTAEPGSTSKIQLGLFSPQLPEPGRLDVTLARIRAIVGEDCVGRAVLKDTQRAEGFRLEAFEVPPISTTAPRRSPRHRVALRVIRPPEGVTVTVQDKRPEAFFFRGIRYVVDDTYGPWLNSGDWWNTIVWSLQQWDLVARARDDTVLCCCLLHDLRQDSWKMVGLYD
jgi:protein ImuB